MNKLLKSTVCLMLILALGFACAGCAINTHSDYQSNLSGNIPADKEEEPQQQDPAPSDPVVTQPVVTQPVVTEPPMSVEEFFGKAAFIGDSVTLKLRNYNTQTKILGDTTFLCQGSYSVDHAVKDTMMLSYQGEDVSPQDALAACGADRVFILLGMNDIGLWGIDNTIEKYGTLIANIREKNPGIDIYIQSGTPIYPSGQRGKLTNANMDAYNEKLEVFAEENGCYYVNINTAFKDETGGLAKKYCSDEYVHFTDAACEMWAQILMQLV